jgi:hypothetical protein
MLGLDPGASIPQPDGDRLSGGLAYREKQHELLARFGALAMRSTDVDALLQRATELCAEGLQVEFCKALERRPELDKLIVRAGIGWKPGVVGHALVGADLDSLRATP